jgi:hypothetical protein
MKQSAKATESVATVAGSGTTADPNALATTKSVAGRRPVDR